MPYDSARIQTVNVGKKDKIQVIKDRMVELLHDNFTTKDAIVRVALNFRVDGSGLDNMTGKTHHCLPIEIPELMELYVYRYRMIFH